MYLTEVEKVRILFSTIFCEAYFRFGSAREQINPHKNCWNFQIFLSSYIRIHIRNVRSIENKTQIYVLRFLRKVKSKREKWIRLQRRMCVCVCNMICKAKCFSFDISNIFGFSLRAICTHACTEYWRCYIFCWSVGFHARKYRLPVSDCQCVYAWAGGGKGVGGDHCNLKSFYIQSLEQS